MPLIRHFFFGFFAGLRVNACFCPVADGGYGLCVAIEGEAYEGHSLTTKYGHCSQILVSAGQEAKAGDVIAKVGCVDVRVGDRVPTVDHHSITDIDSHMACAAG